MNKKIIIITFIIILIMQAIIPIKSSAVDENQAPQVSEKSIFDPNITYTYEWVLGKKLGYSYDFVLITPSNANEYRELPVIVWLHGAGGAGQNEGKSLINEANGIPKILLQKRSKLDNFSAYILCPQLTSPKGQWSASAMATLLTKFKKEYNVDKDNIIISGHSLGGNSAVILANQIPQYFSKAVIFSAGYALATSIPLIWYVGKYETAYYTSAAHQYDALKQKKDVFWVGSGHTATEVAYKKDDGEFVRSRKK